MKKIELYEKENIENINRCNILKVLLLVAPVRQQTYLKFDGMTFENVDCQKYNFSYSSFEGCTMARAIFRGCNLNCTNLSYANLSYANLEYTNLSNADFRGTDLGRANLRNADLRNVKMDRDTIFDGTIFEGTQISENQLIYRREKRWRGNYLHGKLEIFFVPYLT